MYAFFLLGDYPFRSLLYINKRTVALNIRLHPYISKYLNNCFAALRNAAPGALMVLTHIGQCSGEENQDGTGDGNTGLRTKPSYEAWGAARIKTVEA